jgi:hypothetical protein
LISLADPLPNETEDLLSLFARLLVDCMGWKESDTVAGTGLNDSLADIAVIEPSANSPKNSSNPEG